MPTWTRLAFLPLLVVAGACSSASTSPLGVSGSAVDSFPGCSGTFNDNPSPTGAYYATDFGCSGNPYFTDPGDECGSAACIQSAYDEGVCPSGQSNADCQRAVNWYSVGGASYGCGTRLRVSNPSNGKSVVVMVLDNGPSCTVENDADFWVLDVSYPTIMYLFGSEEGWSDHARINAEVVSSSTPLGPAMGDAGITAPVDAGYGSCTGPEGSSGQCIDTSACAAEGGKSTAGECPGPDDIECCVVPSGATVDAGSSVDAGSTSNDAGEAVSLDAGYGSCTTDSGDSGECISTSTCAAHGGTSTADLCPGPDDIQCCIGAN